MVNGKIVFGSTGEQELLSILSFEKAFGQFKELWMWQKSVF